MCLSMRAPVLIRELYPLKWDEWGFVTRVLKKVVRRQGIKDTRGTKITKMSLAKVYVPIWETPGRLNQVVS